MDGRGASGIVRSRALAMALWASMAVGLLPAAGTAAILDVSPDGLGLYGDLQEALAGAQSGDTIRLADGIYSGPGNRNLVLGGLTLTILSAGGDPEGCVLDLGSAGRGFLIFEVPGTAVLLDGLTLRAGNPDLLPPELLGGYGGAIAVKRMAPGGDVRVEHCVFEDNRADAGGGVFVHQGEASFDSCVFRRNLATDGAAAYCGYCGSGDGVRFENSLFYENDYPLPAVGGYGAGVYYSHSLGVVRGCTLARNRAWIGAGILVSTDSAVEVDGCLITHSPEGQGLAVHYGQATVTRCDIFDNYGGDWVGPIADRLGVDCNIQMDPLYCDAAGGNYTLRADSPGLSENNGACGQIGALGLGCPAPPSHLEESEGLSGGPGLDASLYVFPNPAGASATVGFFAERAGHVSLELIDSSGRSASVLFDGRMGSGEHRLAGWRPLDRRGRSLPAGVYFLRYEAGDKRECLRLVVTK